MLKSLSQPRRLPAYLGLLAFAVSDRKSVIAADVIRWSKIEHRSPHFRRALLELIAARPEFRTLIYYRLSKGNLRGKLFGKICLILLPGQRTLYLNSKDIGPGLYIQHGFATVVGGKRIGAGVWINQGVTIGFTVTNEETLNQPTIEDGVTIYAGATVIGNVRVGRDATIGAGAVVTRDVPDGMVAVGVPAVARARGANARSRD